MYIHVISVNKGESKETEQKKAEVEQLESEFDDMIILAQEDMMQKKVEVRHLRQCIIRLPGDLKKEHRLFVKSVKRELRDAASTETHL